MSREQKVAAVEAYFNCFATKDLSKVPLAEDANDRGLPSEYPANGQGHPGEATHRRGRLRGNSV